MSKQSSQDKIFMLKALKLARKGKGHVEPNPMVGCVIVREGKVVASGFHKRFGDDHAEIDALKKINFKAEGATLYVTLEPCHHFGKTPPCVDAVIKSGVRRVVIAMQDPNPKTCGKSIRKLNQAGLTVNVGVCERETRALNPNFIFAMQHQRPHVIFKTAESSNGMISSGVGQQTAITGSLVQKYVHRLRAAVDAVLVGANTVRVDNPQLNVRGIRGARQPLRVILDSKLSLDSRAKIFSSTSGGVILCCTLTEHHIRVKKFRKHGVTVLCFKSKSKSGRVPLLQMLHELQRLGVHSLLVEGGAEVFTAFAKADLIDEWHRFVAPVVLPADGVFLKTKFAINKLTKRRNCRMRADLLLIMTRKYIS